ncbi:hypothetical protein PR202_gb00963 [Eleusine coracana subsp. coracana]|uniref:Beta-glucosidase n=1 Tax=Eleusine coracana subsp. coracana TaxID=191504 RepID=A0AAV5DSZ3_ELECO|nr:hypothetical protein PR202_gb00963 [Eleusine coracana subsp. coracana]
MGGPPCTCRHVFLLLLLQLLLVAPWQARTATQALNFTRQDFPRDFVFGAGTSSYQGRCLIKAQEIWADGYHKYKEDVQLMGDTGLEAYRFSISWSRLIPRGRGPVNPKGLEYYNNVINELVKRGIEIHVTLYHLDFPQILEDEYHGWLSPRVVEDFTAYADVCFREFGDRVKHWTTLDEPNVISIAAYDSGAFPPGRCSPPFGIVSCTEGNSTVEPYIVGHNSILAHTAAVKLYREKYQATQKGVIGMNIYSFWNYPFSQSPADLAATKRSLDFMIGWIVNPLVYGDYPEIMKEVVGSRLPSFTKEQSEIIRGSTDFIGINHYTSVYVSDRSSSADSGLRDYNADIAATFRFSKSDPPSGQSVEWIKLQQSGPDALTYLCLYRSPFYKGYAQLLNDSISDHKRVEYLSSYIGSMLTALRNGANVKGYFVWSFLDVFELLAGYYTRYGLYHVNFQDPELPRQPKLSALWYSKFLRYEAGINIESMVDSDASTSAAQ